jgi:hypothetical protein
MVAGMDEDAVRIVPIEGGVPVVPVEGVHDSSGRAGPPWWVVVVMVVSTIGLVWMFNQGSEPGPVAGTAVTTTVVESTPTPVPPTTSYDGQQQPPWSGLTEDIPEGVESGTVTTSLGSARWVHLNSNEYLLPSLGQLSRNTDSGYTVDGLEIVVAADNHWEFWKSDDGITWRGEIEATSNAFAFEWWDLYVDGVYALGWGINTDPLEIEVFDYGDSEKVDLTGLVAPKSDGFTWTLDVSKPLTRRTDDAVQSLSHVRFSGPDDQVDQRLLLIEHGDDAQYLKVPWDVGSVVSLFGTSETFFAYAGDPNSNQVSVWRTHDGYRWTESGGLHEQLGAPASSSLKLSVLPAIALFFPDDSGVPEYMRNQVVVATTPGYGWESNDGVNWTSAPDGSPAGTDLIRLESGWLATDGDMWWMHLGDSWVSLQDLGMDRTRDGCQIVPRGAGQTTVFFSVGTCTPDGDGRTSWVAGGDLWIISVGSSPEPDDVLNDFVEAYNSGDLDTVMVFFTEESTITGHPFNSNASGLTVIRALYVEDMFAAADADAYSISNVEVTGDTVTWDHVWVDRYGGRNCETGQSAVIEDGKIVSWTWPGGGLGGCA